MQPTYLPWIGYFELIDYAEAFVIYDHVQFVKKSWQQRNRIKTSNGVITLTVPIKKEKRETRICDVEISYDREDPLLKHWKTISLAYGKSKFFADYKESFEQIYTHKFSKLRDLNVAIIKNILDILGIKKRLIFSSELELNEKISKTEDIVNLCKKLGITSLYDAKGAEDFIDVGFFEKENIIIKFQNYDHPQYSQLWGGEFVPYMSIIDLLFNEGEKSLDIIRQGRRT